MAMYPPGHYVFLLNGTVVGRLRTPEESERRPSDLARDYRKRHHPHSIIGVILGGENIASPHLTPKESAR